MEREGGSLRPKDNAYMVRCAIIGELDMHAAARERCAIELNRRHPPCNAVWILDDDFVARRVIAECYLKVPPLTRDTRVKIKPRAPQTDT